MGQAELPEEKLQQAIHQSLPQIRMHGGEIEQVEIDGSHLTVTLTGTCNGCSLLSMTGSALESKIRDQFTGITSVSTRTTQEESQASA